MKMTMVSIETNYKFDIGVAKGAVQNAFDDVHTIMLALLNDFRKFDWAEEYKYPTVILAQMNQLLAECRDDQPVVTP